MKLLLDTHTFIWWDSDPSKLSQQVLALLQDRTNILLLSVTSIWEMQIKIQEQLSVAASGSRLGFKPQVYRTLAEIGESESQLKNCPVHGT